MIDWKRRQEVLAKFFDRLDENRGRPSDDYARETAAFVRSIAPAEFPETWAGLNQKVKDDVLALMKGVQ